MEIAPIAKNWKTIAIQVIRESEKFQADARKLMDRCDILMDRCDTIQTKLNMLHEKRAIYNWSETQLAEIGDLIPLNK